jgi:putative SOS response-associated peptidase YedK
MCGRYTLIGPARIRSAYPQYAFEEFSEYRLPRFNVAPTQDVLAVVNDGSRRVRPLRWGIGNVINVRSESVIARRDRGSHGPAWRSIIFADGFYEWRERKPYYFTLADDALFAFAGIYEPHGGCAIVTVPANEIVALVHDRMPAILQSNEAQALWLEPGDIEDRAAAVLRPYPSEAMRVRPASTRLNAARNDAPDVLVDDDPIQERLF